MSEPFKVGDVVVLKSGGPAMTVTSIGKPAYESVLHVWVSWFDNATSHAGVFPVDAVELAKSTK